MAPLHSPSVPGLTAPRALLFDYGGTLVDEVHYDPHAGLMAVLARAERAPAPAVLDAIVDRAARVAREVADRRDEHHVETPWPSMARLVHDVFGTTFIDSWSDLELRFWNAAVRTEPTPGVHAALQAFRQAGLRMGVLSNSSFGAHVIRHELSKHQLDAFFDVVLVTADYAVRKPNALVFDVAVARLGQPAASTWFVGDRLDTDVAGAHSAGLTSVLYARGQERPEPGAATVVVTDWTALVGVVTGGVRAGGS